MSGSLSSGADIFLIFFQLDSSTGRAEGTVTSASGVGDACGEEGEAFFLGLEFL